MAKFLRGQQAPTETGRGRVAAGHSVQGSRHELFLLTPLVVLDDPLDFRSRLAWRGRPGIDHEGTDDLRSECCVPVRLIEAASNGRMNGVGPISTRSRTR